MNNIYWIPRFICYRISSWNNFWIRTTIRKIVYKSNYWICCTIICSVCNYWNICSWNITKTLNIYRNRIWSCWICSVINRYSLNDIYRVSCFISYRISSWNNFWIRTTIRKITYKSNDWICCAIICSICNYWNICSWNITKTLNIYSNRIWSRWICSVINCYSLNYIYWIPRIICYRISSCNNFWIRTTIRKIAYKSNSWICRTIICSISHYWNIWSWNITKTLNTYSNRIWSCRVCCIINCYCLNNVYRITRFIGYRVSSCNNFWIRTTIWKIAYKSNDWIYCAIICSVCHYWNIWSWNITKTLDIYSNRVWSCWICCIINCYCLNNVYRITRFIGYRVSSCNNFWIWVTIRNIAYKSNYWISRTIICSISHYWNISSWNISKTLNIYSYRVWSCWICSIINCYSLNYIYRIPRFIGYRVSSCNNFWICISIRNIAYKSNYWTCCTIIFSVCYYRNISSWNITKTLNTYSNRIWSCWICSVVNSNSLNNIYRITRFIGYRVSSCNNFWICISIRNIAYKSNDWICCTIICSVCYYRNVSSWNISKTLNVYIYRIWSSRNNVVFHNYYCWSSRNIITIISYRKCNNITSNISTSKVWFTQTKTWNTAIVCTSIINLYCCDARISICI